MEAVKTFYNVGRKPDVYYWRSHDGLEVDLLIQNGQCLIPVEIKLNATPKPQFLRPCERLRQFAAGTIDLEPPVLVCKAEESLPLPNDARCIPWHHFGSWLRQHIG